MELLEVEELIIDNPTNNSNPSLMVYKISNNNYKLVPLKKVNKPEGNLSCDECGLMFVSKLRLKWHRSTHDPLGHKQKQGRTANRTSIEVTELSESELVKTRSSKEINYLCPSCNFHTTHHDLMIDHFQKEHSFSDDIKQSDNKNDQQVIVKGDKNKQEKLSEEEKKIHQQLARKEKRKQQQAVKEDPNKQLEEQELLLMPIDFEEILETNKYEIEKDQNEANEDEEEKEEEEENEFQLVDLKCKNCGYEGQDEADLDFHTCALTDVKTEMTFTCHICNYEGLTSMGLQSHITRKHRPRHVGQTTRNYNCEYCEFTTTYSRTMHSHRRKHLKAQAGATGAQQQPTNSNATSSSSRSKLQKSSYFCNECNFAARTKGLLYLHMYHQHKDIMELDEPAEPLAKMKGPKPKKPTLQKCDQCDYTCKHKYEMKVHVIRKHTDQYNFACELCGKKYKIRSDLTNHIRFQHREQPIICDVCGKTCGNSNSLYVHQKFAHYKSEFECHICHRRMVSQANLDEHILKQHEQREDAVCEECGKTFTRSSRLKIHMRIHTGDKPFSCKICNKSFARKTGLRQHLIIHTGQRPYVCDVCGKAFTQKPGLISHRKSHPGPHPPLPRMTIEHVLSDLLNEEGS